MLRTTIAAVLSLCLTASVVHADEAPIVAAPPSSSIRTSIATVRFDTPDHSLPFPWQPPARRNGPAQKVTAAFALGVLGLFGGGVIGSSFGRQCACDDPGLKGALIGAPIGAAAGAILGFRLASR